MTAKQKIIFVIVILFIITLACGPLPSREPEEPEPPIEDVVATSVAATMAASGDDAAPDAPAA